MMKPESNSNLILALFILCNLSVRAQAFLTVKDSLTNQEIPYVNVDLLNGHGFFSDEHGRITISASLPRQIKLTHLGYKDKTILEPQAGITVWLEREPIVLSEVKIIAAKQKTKPKEITVKPFIHNDVGAMYWSAIAQQLAFYIPYEKPDGYLKSISIPLIEKDFDQQTGKGPLKRQPYKTMLKLELFSNLNQQPQNLLSTSAQYAVIDSEQVKNKFDLLLDQPFMIPQEGLFVVCTIIGKATGYGQLLPEFPYTEEKAQGQTKKFLKLILPDYPLVEAPAGTPTLFRQLFAGTGKWFRIEQPMVYKKKRQYGQYNIGLGYTISY